MVTTKQVIAFIMGENVEIRNSKLPLGGYFLWLPVAILKKYQVPNKLL
jgi:hypothetical protein